jgi:3'-phosphoadenosine 5'-phosphosulfate sulfotransferase (PAPS reductase)/FAD synthetase
MAATPHDIAGLRPRLDGHLVIASVSGGKDSAALSLYLTELGIEHERMFLDTGWEEPRTYEYLRGPLTAALGPIAWVSGPKKMVSLILKKGMFPSRQRRFCTQELKIFPAQAHFERRMAETGMPVANAVGIRRAESRQRAQLSEWDHWDWKGADRLPLDAEVWRPLIDWSVDEVVAIHKRHGLRPNPLYLEGAARVGCWPCIYARKEEIRHIAEHDPGRIDLIRLLEARTARRAARRYAEKGETFESLGYGKPSWFQAPMPERKMVPCEDCGGTGDLARASEPTVIECPRCEGTGERLYRSGKPTPIDEVVQWARTSHGGRQVELFAAPPSEQGCMRWGLCETEAPDWKDEA